MHPKLNNDVNLSQKVKLSVVLTSEFLKILYFILKNSRSRWSSCVGLPISLLLNIEESKPPYAIRLESLGVDVTR